MWHLNNLVQVDAANATSFTVTAESGNKTTYSVKLVAAKAFTEFSVAGERKAAEIGLVTEDVATKTVKVFMPYGTAKDINNKFQFTPTYSKAYASAKVEVQKLSDGSYVELVSGEEVELSDYVDLSNTDVAGALLLMRVTYSEDKTETWTLSFDVPANDPVAAIKSLSVSNYNATIDGKNISLALPETVRDNATQIIMSASVGTKIELIGTGKSVVADGTDAATLTVNAGDLAKKDTFGLRVTAAGKEPEASSNQVVDYTLTISTAAVESAKMSTMTLDDGDGNQYEASIDQAKGTITFEVPYSVRTAADMNGWKLFYTASSGSVVTALGTSGSKLTGSESYIPVGDAVAGFDDAHGTVVDCIRVSTPDLDSKVYSMVFKNAAAKTGSTLSTVELTSVYDFDSMTDTNTIQATVSGKKLTVNVPFSQWANFDEAAVATVLPEGAKLYWVDNNKDLHKLGTLNEDITTVQNWLPSIANAAANVAPDYSNEDTPLTLVVASEALAVEIEQNIITNTADFDNGDLGKYTTYTLSVLKNAPRETAELTGFAVYDATSKQTATGTISGTDITITLPYYFQDDARNSKLYLDFSVVGGEALSEVTASFPLTDLTLKKDGTVDVASSTPVTYDSVTKTLKVDNDTYSINKINVTSEDGRTKVPYTVTVKIAEPNTEAKLNSVTIKGATGTPDANNNVNIVLPYGTEVTSLVPTFNISTNAYVTDYVGNVVEEGDAYNFLSERKFTVHSEDGNNTAIYTISVTTGEQFSDIDENDWFYSNVIRAVELGVLSGYDDGTFRPMNSITRRDFAIMLAQSLGNSNDGEATSPFKDVADNDYGVVSIAYLYEKGIVTGDDKGNFNPDSNITRQEAAIMLAKAFEATGTTSDLFTDDASIASWAKSFVYAAKAAGLMNGDTNGAFRPTSTITRAEAASAMVNAIDK